MSISKQRLEQQAARLLAEIIHDELQDPRLPMFVGIERVDLSPDNASAVVYVSALERTADTVNILNHAHSFLQDELAQRMKLRRIPRLRFVEAV
ncbi:30S ribosome-binding factor RbfA [Calidithermus chliarophilus]|uniref:30S ribosome-binding factor RbfA n=1 Tax=Calidithermus chliarophilus TaxID=52023 RepID=UPI00041B5318|nr:30S ribosome-binding factor RbfA [Calidithermus chliarophilus]